MSCAVKNCHRRILPTNRGYRFPKNEAQRKQWLKFCCLSMNFDTKAALVCVQHFKPEDFANGMECDMGFAKKRNLKHGTVPSINTAAIKNMDLYKKREIRKQKRENKKIVEKLLQEHTLREKSVLEEKMFEPITKSVESEDPLNQNVLPNLNAEEDCIKVLRQELDVHRKQNLALQEAYSLESKEKEENISKISRITKIYERNLDILNTRLATAKKELAILKKSMRKKAKRNKSKQMPNDI